MQKCSATLTNSKSFSTLDRLKRNSIIVVQHSNRTSGKQKPRQARGDLQVPELAELADAVAERALNVHARQPPANKSTHGP